MSGCLVKPLKLWDFWKVSSHTKFLNAVFGTNYSENYTYRKSSFEYSENTIAWFVRFDGKERNGFINSWVDKNDIKQTYVGETGLFDGKPLNLKSELDYRLVFEIIDKPLRKYIFNGLYKLDRYISTQQYNKDGDPRYELVFRKISDIFPIK